MKVQQLASIYGMFASVISVAQYLNSFQKVTEKHIKKKKSITVGLLAQVSGLYLGLVISR